MRHQIKIAVALTILYAVVSPTSAADRSSKRYEAEITFMTKGNLAGIPEKCFTRHWSRRAVGERGDSECIRAIGEHMPAIDPANREAFGELYNPKKWVECELSYYSNPPGTKHPYSGQSCPLFALRRPENPEDWPNPKAPPKWPELPKESVYRLGMDAKTYFEALCKAEAGEFIYKTVENVEGYYVARPRAQDSDEVLSDKYVVEDPWGAYQNGPPSNSYLGTVSIPRERSKVYRNFVEAPFPKGRPPGTARYPGNLEDISFFAVLPDGVRYWRIVGYDGYDLATTRKEFTNSLNSRYAISWRGIRRPHDRDIEKDAVIAGGEVGIFDMHTGELLGLRRQFMASRRNQLGKFWWLNAAGCQQFFDEKTHRRNRGDFGFINAVLKTIDNPLSSK